MGQMSLFKLPSSEFGGELSLGKRKTARPLSSTRPIHLVFRSDIAIGPYSFRRTANRLILEQQIKKWSEHFQIKVYKYSVNSNHLHLAVLGPRRMIQNFLRTFSGQSAQRLLKAWRALPQRLWSLPVYSRIAHWGKAFTTLLKYIEKNRLESEGQIAYVPRKKDRGSHTPAFLNKSIKGSNSHTTRIRRSLREAALIIDYSCNSVAN